jgi:hypothetical protein
LNKKNQKPVNFSSWRLTEVRRSGGEVFRADLLPLSNWELGWKLFLGEPLGSG